MPAWSRSSVLHIPFPRLYRSAAIHPSDLSAPLWISAVGLSRNQNILLLCNTSVPGRLLAISSSRSLPIFASHILKGSAFGEAIDCMMRRSCSVLATSVNLILPSDAGIFNCLQFVSSSLPSSLIRFFKTAQYVLALRTVSWSVKIATTSIDEAYPLRENCN